ncbi:hypothetical protein FS837_005328 [Tulasnella sp. UAMH 9824]|nr:hypothetical protein FS837_005328 [Tulasnella sp. UAMH 9824]
MDSHRSTRKADSSTQVATHLRYPHRLNLYERPPLDEITLEQFETWAIDRLRILAEIEASLARNRTQEELKTVIKSQCAKYLPLSANSAHERPLDAERQKDHISHFILRLAFCRTEDLRRRFTRVESLLFRTRFEDEDSAERLKFLEAHGSQQGEPVDDSEKALLRPKLAVASGFREDQIDKEPFVKLPWTKVLSLVDKRRVYLQRGVAYVPQRELSTVVFQDFSSRLEKALEQTHKQLGDLDEDDRLTPILDHLGKGFVAGVNTEYGFGDEVAPGDAVTASMVDALAKDHWPLCAKNLHASLKREKHLKYNGRLQYGLFLKGVGMSLEEAMIFWRKSFSGMSDDKFRKEYSYNIKHTYGQVGSRINYTPKSCVAIITGDNPGAGQNHGCPFKHFSPDNLTLALSTHYDINNRADVQDILNAVKQDKYHVACTRVYEITHAAQGVKRGDGVGEGESVTHPNSYAMRSRELAKKGGVKKEEAMEVDS